MSPSDKKHSLKKELAHMRESLNDSHTEIQNLKEILNEMTLSKQYLINELHETQFTNVKLVRRLDKQRDSFAEENELLKLEMGRIKSSLKLMQRSLHVSNRKLARHMRGCAGTRFRLGEMFLRMRSTKRRHERHRNRYQQMCLQFAAYVREQNRYMLAAVEAKLSNESISACHRQYLDLLTRCSQLLHENMNLRLLAMNQSDEAEDQPNRGSDGESTVGETVEKNQDTTESEETIFKKYIKAPERQRHHSI
ncbi:uncharacterized protein LOC135701917 [Ochlerotatus camptorhynchus]|uniref:uncharacterized protein LOC135701917 n=1 Tax=Ochlerotatus camptorhynchus TaxID=644619 RepID=UPI0031D877B1